MANYFFTNAVANAILFHNGKMLYNHWFLFNNFVHILWPKRPWKTSKSKPQNFVPLISKNFTMRFRRKKFRHNFLILLVFMSLFSSPTTWSNNNSIWNKTSLKSLEKRKKKKYIIEFLLEKTGLKVKTSNFFFTKVLSRKMQRFLWA